MARERDLAHRRRRMVADQLAARGITDVSVLDAMGVVPRERFVARHLRHRAYDDAALPAANGQTISQPWIVAYMAQELLLRASDRVLEVGAGTGYAAAVLGRLVAEVTTIERDPELADRARARLAALGVDNVVVVAGDGSLGWPDGAPWDAISVTAVAPSIPPPLVDQLAPSGRLILPVRNRDERLVRVTRGVEGLITEELRPVRFVPLTGKHGYRGQ